jgi:LPS export ABC transporter protein LptC
MRWILIAVTFALITGCGQDSTMPSAGADEFDLASDQVGFGTRHIMTREGVRTAIITSDTTYVYDDARRVDLVGVQVSFYTESGVEAGEVTSRNGDYDMSSGIFVARQDVVLLTEGPEGMRRLETEELHYDVNGDVIWSDTPFTLHEAGRVTRGSTFRSDSRFETWEVTGARTEGSVNTEGSD